MFLGSIMWNFRYTAWAVREYASLDKEDWVARVNDAMIVWLFMSVFFSLASYGLSE